MYQRVKAALVVVDVQRYYIDPGSSFYKYSEHCWPGAMGYIGDRVGESLIPAVSGLRKAFSGLGWPTVYLRLCAAREDRSDLHRFFRAFWKSANISGFPDTYPMAGDPFADVAPEIAPLPGDMVIDKSTYSGFTSTELEKRLRAIGVNTLIMSGLATSQCVDTTARDASERGFMVVHAEDALADYSEARHAASLYASNGVCGGHILASELLIEDPAGCLARLAKEEDCW